MERGSLYPSWRYHPDGRSQLVTTADQDAALTPDWSDADVRHHINAVVVVAEEPEAPEAEPDTAPETPKKKRGRPKKS